MEIMATSKNYGKKGSDHFRDILNPYGEKFNYGKIGRRRRLSKLSFFFHNSVGDCTLELCMYVCMNVCMYVCMSVYVYVYVYVYVMNMNTVHHR